MSLIWPAPEGEIKLGEPRLHALIVAVGNYPHLPGGDGPPALDPLGLSQVSTPRPTGRAIATWLTSSYHNSECPLGSVEVLVSPGETYVMNDGRGVQVESGTMMHLKQAFTRWFNRCATHRDNIAFFYFCGHGLSKAAQFLLPENFGDPSLVNRWENCVDFDAMRVGMRSNAAQTQLFFVDACRETPFGMLTRLNVKGDPLVDADIFDSVRCCAAYYATAEGKQAYGPADDITFFGRAVLSCLNGVASLNKNGRWIVDSFQLGSALGQVMEQLSKRYRLPLTCNPNVVGMARIHEVSGPRVLVSLQCSSAGANEAAEIVMSHGSITISSGLGQPKPIVAEVEPGEWRISVRFPNNEFVAPTAQIITLMPPVFEGVDVP